MYGIKKSGSRLGLNGRQATHSVADGLELLEEVKQAKEAFRQRSQGGVLRGLNGLLKVPLVPQEPRPGVPVCHVGDGGGRDLPMPRVSRRRARG